MSIQAYTGIANTPAAAQPDELEDKKKQYLSKFKNLNARYTVQELLKLLDCKIRKATNDQNFIAAKVHVEVQSFQDRRLLAIVNRNLKMERGQEAVKCLLPVIMDDSLPNSLDAPLFNGLLFDVLIYLKNKEDLYGLFHTRYGLTGRGELASGDWFSSLEAKKLIKMSKTLQNAYATKSIKILDDNNEFIEGCQPEPEQKERKWCVIA